MNEIKEYTEKVFDDARHIDENGNEYWKARELMPLLEYTEWRKFNGVINRAVINCKSSNYNLNRTAINSGVKDLARFHNAGYKGLINVRNSR